MREGQNSARLLVCIIAGLAVTAGVAAIVVQGSEGIMSIVPIDDCVTAKMANSYTPHSRIVIDSDADFADQAAANSWPGDGTLGIPYVIMGYSINATGLKQAIFIGNSTVHFVISGCYLTGASESGVQLLNVQNGSLRDNLCLSNVWNGLAIVNSAFVNATNNSCQGSHYGILLQSSDSCILMNNNCSENGDGILVQTSNENEISGNICDGNIGDSVIDFGDGIRLFESHLSVVSLNSCSLNGRYQIRLEYSEENTIENNTLVDGPYPVGQGLYLLHSNSNVISGLVLSYAYIELDNSDFNEISWCSGGVLSLKSYSSWNTVVDNDCYGQGISLSVSDNNTIARNVCSLATKGIYMWSSNDNIVANNTCIENTGKYISMSNRPPGIGIQTEMYCYRNVFSGNNCSYSKFGGGGGAWGIYAPGMGGDSFTDNIVTYGEGSGMYASGPNTVVSNNIVQGNLGTGMMVSSTGGSLVENNTVRYNGNEGIIVTGDGTMVVSNFVTANGGKGIQSDSSSSGHIYLNNQLVNDGIFPDSQFEWVDTSNTVNDRPVYHLRSQNGGAVPSGAGQVILYLCAGVVVEGQNLSMADIGIILEQSTSCIIQDNTCTMEITGIWLYSSASNTVSSNNISGNIEAGLWLESSNDNEVWGNGVFDNVGYGIAVWSTGNWIWNNTFARNNGAGSTYDSLHIQAYSSGANFWNDSSFGNYWGDWVTPDLDYDGIVDQPYTIAGFADQEDYYPRTTPTVTIPPQPIPELGPAALVFVVTGLVIVVSASARSRHT